MKTANLALMASEPKGTLPFAAFEWMVSLRYLTPHRKGGMTFLIAILSFLSFFIGVSALIIVMSVMNGFRIELQSKILGFNGHIIVSPRETPLTDYEAVASRIAKVPSVKSAMPFVEGQVFVSSSFSGSGAIVRGLRLEDLRRLPGLANNIKGGVLDTFDQGQGVVIGARLASSLGLQIGDSITLTSPKGDQTVLGTTLRQKPYQVMALFEVGMSDIDSGFVIMSLSESQAFFNRNDDVTAIEVYLKNPDLAQSERETLKSVASRPVSLVDWRQRNSAFFTALQVERNVMFMILLILVIMAALGVVSSMTMLVQSKQPDIAIMRTMGAERGAILRIFFITGMVIGALGTLFGVIAGLLVCNYIEDIQKYLSWALNTQLFPSEVYFLSNLPAKVDLCEVAIIIFTTLILCFLATLYPAWKAAKLDPVEALRGG
ncbi:lipoprotein-releasing ABC transporter permease subunit [Labrys sp. 22185]|uniref:lipoprotein-releasing ABC transporter permease subunit n=1 Tax=Labrys sp. 22185 TaxID=3453888 RepID=UPI003F82D9BE